MDVRAERRLRVVRELPDDPLRQTSEHRGEEVVEPLGHHLNVASKRKHDDAVVTRAIHEVVEILHETVYTQLETDIV